MGPRQRYCQRSRCRNRRFEEEVRPELEAFLARERHRESRERHRERRLASRETFAEAEARRVVALRETIEDIEDPTLLALIVEQAEDARLGHRSCRPWELSLDAPVFEDGASLLDFVYGEVEDEVLIARIALGWRRRLDVGEPDAWVVPLLEALDRRSIRHSR